MDKRLVKEFYDINDVEVRKLADKNDYYLKVRDFWFQVKDKEVDKLTPGQASWLSKIEEDITENHRPNFMREDYENNRSEFDKELA